MQIVCLAKSRKYGGRCVAGVEVEPGDYGGHRVVRQAGEPRWIRPVTDREHGELPACVIEDVCLLDIIELIGVQPDPQGYQAENVRFDQSQIRVVRKLPREAFVLDHFVTQRAGPVFGNRGKAIPADRAAAVDHSLLLIRVGDAEFHDTETMSGKPQLRVSFSHALHRYDLPVTDPEFDHDRRKGTLPAEYSCCYLTLSLGVEHEGWHSKLVAGVFLF